MRKVGSIGIILLLFLATLSAISFTSTAGLVTIVQARVEGTVYVDVSPGSTGIMNINATIVATNYNTSTPLIINLSTTITAGQATLNKTQLVFQGGHQSEDVNITIQIPIENTSTTLEYSCFLSGTWQQGGDTGSVGGGNTNIIILPYYRFEVNPEQSHKETRQSESAIFNFTIENTGNCNDEYRVDIENMDELGALGISFPSYGKMIIEEGDLGNFVLPVNAGDKIPIGDYEIQLIITSTGSEEEEGEPVTNSFTLFLKVNPQDSTEEHSSNLYIPFGFFILCFMGFIFLIIIIRRKKTGN
jgi:hypothetical protein